MLWLLVLEIGFIANRMQLMEMGVRYTDKLLWDIRMGCWDGMLKEVYVG